MKDDQLDEEIWIMEEEMCIWEALFQHEIISSIEESNPSERRLDGRWDERKGIKKRRIKMEEDSKPRTPLIRREEHFSWMWEEGESERFE